MSGCIACWVPWGVYCRLPANSEAMSWPDRPSTQLAVFRGHGMLSATTFGLILVAPVFQQGSAWRLTRAPDIILDRLNECIACIAALAPRHNCSPRPQRATWPRSGDKPALRANMPLMPLCVGTSDPAAHVHVQTKSKHGPSRL